MSVTGPFVKKMQVFKNLVAGVSPCPITIYAPIKGGSYVPDTDRTGVVVYPKDATRPPQGYLSAHAYFMVFVYLSHSIFDQIYSIHYLYR